MRGSTPFFPAFVPLLFGRSPVNAAVSALKDAVQREEAIKKLTAGFSHFFGDSLRKGPAIDEEEGIVYRDRCYTQQITFWAFLLQVLTSGSACREAVRRVQLWWKDRDDEKALSADTGAYCRARARLPFAWLEELFHALCTKLTSGIAAHQLWCERRVKILDGTTISMPDTAANQEFWPQQKAQKRPLLNRKARRRVDPSS
ncbi:hypothetical protein ACXR0O_15115 [Verrucomicrobiota bacterium sgz303538]